ncbi:hypothetical protein Tco_0149595 [Tanacetum coccineum]
MPAAKASKSQQPKPVHAKPREKKRKLVTETSEAPSLAKQSKAGVPDKELLYGDEEADTVPDSGKFQPLLEIQGKRKEKVGVEQAAQVLLNLQTLKKKSLADHEMESDKEVLPMIQSGAQDEGQARPNPVHKAVHAGPNLEHMDSEVTDTLIQQNPEQMDEEFITTAYPNVQENLKLPTEDQVRLEEPASSAGTLSSLRNLDKELIFADQFLMEKS